MAKGIVRAREGGLELDGKDFRIRGYGLGNWLNIEHFMLGLPGTETELRELLAARYGAEGAAEFWKAFRAAYMSDADFTFMAATGATAVRIPFNYNLVAEPAGAGNPGGGLSAAGAALIDDALKMCERAGLRAILDLHTAPGGQNPDWHSDNQTGRAMLWNLPAGKGAVERLWSDIAARYAGSGAVAAYDLLNEPVIDPAREGELAEFLGGLIAAVRAKDAEHLIFIEGNVYAQRFDALLPLLGDNVGFSYHFYPANDRRSMRRSKARSRMLAGAVAGLPGLKEARGRAPLWCGETGANWARLGEGPAAALIADSVDAQEALGAGWSLWAYKDARQMGMLRPKADSPWMALSRAAFGPWTLGRDFQELPAEGEAMRRRLGLSGFEAERVWFRVMALEQRILLERLDDLLAGYSLDRLVACCDSFRFDNCERWGALEAALRARMG